MEPCVKGVEGYAENDSHYHIGITLRMILIIIIKWE